MAMKQESKSIRVPSDGSEPEPTTENAQIHIRRVWQNKYYEKVGIETPAPWEDDGEANEVMKELDYDMTHWKWNEEADEWEADLDMLNHIVDHFNTSGYDVTVAVDVARAFESGERTFLPEKR